MVSTPRRRFCQFDLIFRCPKSLRLVSTGEPVSDEIVGDERIVRRRTNTPERFAGFNLGNYDAIAVAHGPFRIECYGDRGVDTPDRLKAISDDIAGILDDYTGQWGPLPIRSVAVSPIPGYFGQGFPGLIYLSTCPICGQKNGRFPRRMRYSIHFFPSFCWRMRRRTNGGATWSPPPTIAANGSWKRWPTIRRCACWKKRKGRDAMEQVLDQYRADLLANDDTGQMVEAAGPLEMGSRVVGSRSQRTWRIITYEKGSWVLHMLRERLGADAFTALQARLIREYTRKPLTNEDFRKMASDFVPAGQPDRSLEIFFDTWVYGTGIPRLQLTQTGRNLIIKQGNVDDSFAADIPVVVKAADGQQAVHWIRMSSDDETIELPRGSTARLPATGAFLYRK